MPFHTHAQEFKIALEGLSADSVRDLTGIKRVYSGYSEARESLEAARQLLWGMGYLEFNYDQPQWTDSSFFAEIHLGPPYRYARIRPGNIATSVLDDIRWDPSNLKAKTLDPARLQPFVRRLLMYFENRGYPFVSVCMDSIQIKNGEFTAALRLDKGPLVKIDTILLNENMRLNRIVFLRQVGLRDGMLYDESKIRSLSARINELPYLGEDAPWRINFNIARTTLNVFLKNKNANRADVLIGLLPNNSETGGRFLLTGDIRLSLVNALGQGEQVHLNWQNLQYRSPRMNLDFAVPFILNLPVGLSGKFDFYKKDTTFRTVQGELGLIYPLNLQSQLKVYYELSGSRLLSVNLAKLQSERRLPEQADVNYRTFGIELLWQHLDYRLNPRKGYSFLLNAAIGFRNFQKNTSIETAPDPQTGATFSWLYDSVRLQSSRYRLQAQIAYYYRLSKRLVLALQYSGAWTYSNNSLFRNELFQIGGYRLLRGFDEGSLFVNTYHVVTVEPRFIVSRNSFFFAFADASYIQSKFATTFLKDTPYGFGAGMNFDTKAGIFRMSYALGGRNQQPIRFRNSKIHFGYISYF